MGKVERRSSMECATSLKCVVRYFSYFIRLTTVFLNVTPCSSIEFHRLYWITGRFIQDNIIFRSQSCEDLKSNIYCLLEFLLYIKSVVAKLITSRRVKSYVYLIVWLHIYHIRKIFKIRVVDLGMVYLSFM
jgi:hypothetical protein